MILKLLAELDQQFTALKAERICNHQSDESGVILERVFEIADELENLGYHVSLDGYARKYGLKAFYGASLDG